MGACIPLQWPATAVHYGVRIVLFCEITTLNPVVHDADEWSPWDDVNLGPSGMCSHHAFDPYVLACVVLSTTDENLLGRIIRVSGWIRGISEPVTRSALFLRHCLSAFSPRFNRCQPNRMDYSNLRCILFYIPTATTEVCDLSGSTITILHSGSKRRGGSVSIIPILQLSTAMKYRATILQGCRTKSRYVQIEQRTSK